ncbi:MAG: hypothetical protein CXZ00_06975 [Acidobacteria bacterium]|nr:MAG: hypothetical protein CXZ00_06975 [Acidobacteriota bacterium]
MEAPIKHRHLYFWLATVAVSSAIFLAGCGSGSGNSSVPRNVQVSAIYSYYGAQGKVNVPQDLSGKDNQIAALIPEADGSITTIACNSLAAGTCMIPQVPAGYYWLQQTTPYVRYLFWTNSSTFDLGQNLTGRPFDGKMVNTIFDVDLTGLYPVPNPTVVSPAPPVLANPNLLYSLFPLYTNFADATTVSGTVGGRVAPPDPSKGDTTYVYQMAPVTSIGLPSEWYYSWALTTALALPNFTVNADGNTVVRGAMSRSNPAALNFNIDGPSWGTAVGASENSLFSNLQFSASVQPFLTKFDSGNGIDLIRLDVHSPWSEPVNIFQNISATIDYDNPFPRSWPIVYEIWAYAPAGTGSFVHNSYRTTTLPSSFTPQMAPVQNPTINGASLQNPPAIANPDTPITLSWLPPIGHAPDTYSITIHIQGTSGNTTSDTILAQIVTPQTSVTIPAGLLGTGNNYYVTIGAFSATGFSATSPYRQGFPSADASVISGTFAVGPAPAVAASTGKVRMIPSGTNGKVHTIPLNMRARIP